MKGRETGSAMSHTHAIDCPGTISHALGSRPAALDGPAAPSCGIEAARSTLAEKRPIHLRELRAERRPGIARIRHLSGQRPFAAALLQLVHRLAERGGESIVIIGWNQPTIRSGDDDLVWPMIGVHRNGGQSAGHG